ncbi:MAG: JAB domain-containing protein [Ferruginibacter sp.]
MKIQIATDDLLVSEVELIYRSKVKPSNRVTIRSPKDAYDIFLKLWDVNKIDFVEEFKVMFLNKANKVLGIYHISSGGLTSTIADIRIVFAAALKINACAIIVCHNHPSGGVKPSMADSQLTKNFTLAGSFLQIILFDHLIITTEGYFSFADEGALY